jgi:prepilin signal peptidase PulO-like enzyme (type II secretory pathway)
MFAIFIFYVFLLGAIVGSFINVVALRYGTKMSSLKGRSICFFCDRTLRWFEMVPILSFLFLRGKCRTCKAELSLQYFLVELGTGLVFVGIFLRQYGLWQIYSLMSHGLLYSVLFFFYYAAIFSILIIIFLYDLRHKIIPNALVYSFIVLSLGKLFLFLYCQGLPLTTVNLFNLLAPIILSLPFALLWYFSDGKWIGFGDAKLIFGLGALLGIVLGLSAVVLAFWLGTLWVLLVWLRAQFSGKKALAFGSEIPLAPFLILAIFLVFLWHFDFFGLNLLF